MTVKVRPEQLRKFADDVMHDTAAHYRSINDYIPRYCADTAGLEGLISAVAPILQLIATGFHAATAQGAANLAATAEDLSRTAKLFQADDDKAATQIWLAGRQKYEPPSGTDEMPYVEDPKKWLKQPNVGAEEGKNLPKAPRTPAQLFVMPAEFTNLPAPQIPGERADFDTANNQIDSILKVLDQVLSKVGFSILEWIKPLVGDWGVVWKIADAWRNVGFGDPERCGHLAMSEELTKQLTNLDYHWDGEAARSFTHSMHERWRPALVAAQQLANVNQQLAEAIAASWQGLYATVLAVVEYLAGRIIKIVWKIARGNAGELIAEITGALKGLWVVARKLLEMLVEQAQAVHSLIAGCQGRDDMKVLQTG